MKINLNLGLQIPGIIPKQQFTISTYNNGKRNTKITKKLDKKWLFTEQLQVFFDSELLTNQKSIVKCDGENLFVIKNALPLEKQFALNEKKKLIGYARKRIILKNILCEDGKDWLILHQFQVFNWEHFDSAGCEA